MKNSRTALIRYLNASFCGCGRWKWARTPFFSNVTEDPSPLMIRHPIAVNSDSIRDHSMAPSTGSVNIAVSVFRCLLFMGIMIAIFIKNASKGLMHWEKFMLDFLNDLDGDLKKALLVQLRNLWTHMSTAIEGNMRRPLSWRRVGPI